MDYIKNEREFITESFWNADKNNNWNEKNNNHEH